MSEPEKPKRPRPSLDFPGKPQREITIAQNEFTVAVDLQKVSEKISQMSTDVEVCAALSALVVATNVGWQVSADIEEFYKAILAMAEAVEWSYIDTPSSGFVTDGPEALAKLLLEIAEAEPNLAKEAATIFCTKILVEWASSCRGNEIEDRILVDFACKHHDAAKIFTDVLIARAKNPDPKQIFGDEDQALKALTAIQNSYAGARLARTIGAFFTAQGYNPSLPDPNPS